MKEKFQLKYQKKSAAYFFILLYTCILQSVRQQEINSNCEQQNMALSIFECHNQKTKEGLSTYDNKNSKKFIECSNKIALTV